MSRSDVEAPAGAPWELVLPRGEPMRFRRIPAGEFRMGARGVRALEEPVHRVVIPEVYWMGETPVTQAQLEVWTSVEGIEHRNGFPGRPDHPAESMTWNDAVRFCEWLTPMLPEGYSARLPDESRWEHACRAGTETEYWSGDGEAALAEVGWYRGNSEDSTRPVGTKPANAWGLHDMHGNVWEWCADVYDGHAYRKRVDGWKARASTLDDEVHRTVKERAQKSPYRVLRGGSWVGTARDCRSALRDRIRPSARFRDVGFRVCLARSLPAGQQAGEPEPSAGGVARRDDEAEPDGARPGESTDIDLARERSSREPKRRGGEKKQ